jgi:hypothetical protein
MTAQLEQAIMLIDDVRNALENEHPAIHQDLVEVRWFNTAEVQPANEQKVIVRTQTGEVYFLTYPFNHTKYPMWWVIPQNNE